MVPELAILAGTTLMVVVMAAEQWNAGFIKSLAVCLNVQEIATPAH